MVATGSDVVKVFEIIRLCRPLDARELLDLLHSRWIENVHRARRFLLRGVDRTRRRKFERQVVSRSSTTVEETFPKMDASQSPTNFPHE